MKYKIEIDMDNAAFEDNEVGELIAILENLINKITLTGEIGRRVLRDSNGNRVGFAEPS